MKPRNLPANTAEPLTMHIDLNSCFAIIEQQANRLLRGRPVAVAAYDTPRGMILAASYEAKRRGIKLGYSVGEARAVMPDIVVMTPDPAKYREAHRRFKELLLTYTDDVHPKSIDEFVLNLENSPSLRAGLSPSDVGYAIKDHVRRSLGEAVTVNVGIGPNRFLAKLAAGLHKPDGLDIITHQNLEKVYSKLQLVDLPGINVRYDRRLRTWGIATPLDFYKASVDVLQKQVFKGIVGYYWYRRLRGWEIDSAETVRRSIGHQHALSHKTDDKEELARLLIKLCEKVGRRLRKDDLCAYGIHLYLSFVRDRDYMNVHRSNGFLGGESVAERHAWHRGVKLAYPLYSTRDIYLAAKRLLEQAEMYNLVRGISITVFALSPVEPRQLSLLEDDRQFAANLRLSQALDTLNDRYGEFVVVPGNMMNMRGTILDRIAFGSVRDL